MRTVTMTNNYIFLRFYFLFLIPLAWPTAQASVARMDIAFGDQPPTPVYIELFDIQTPVTVTNFLNYIEDAAGQRRYDGTFLHRSIPGFIVQGGGYAYNPALGAFGPFSARHIPLDPQIVNEFGLSNLRGTIVMAKQAGNPDSATSEWFFNLGDNSANLDFQNGGFTVFGQVLGSGMTTIDSIAALGTENFGGAFTNLPLFNHIPGTPVLTLNLVTTTLASSPYSSPLFVNPAPLNFGAVVVGTGPIQQVVTLLNVGNTNLTLGNIASLDSLSAPFSITSDNCSNLPLTSFATCTLVLEFAPTTAGQLQDTFDIPSDSTNQPTVTFNVFGQGEQSQADIIGPQPATVDFGDTQFDIPVTLDVPFFNQGNDNLIVTSISITGINAGEFSVTNNCQPLVPAQQFCTESVTFTPSGTGEKSATLEISSNDPDTPVLSLPITATSSMDNDGIPDLIESAGPNNGDANNDGIPDLQQQNVASLPDINGDYTILEAGTGQELVNVSVGPSPSPNTTPISFTNGASVSFESGFFSFTVTGLAFGESTTLTLTLPEGRSPAAYFKYGLLPTESSSAPPHFYQFDFDQTTGIGAEIQGNRIILHLIDGGPGDNDQSEDGRIVDPGGPATLTLSSSNGSGGGGGGGCSAVTKHRDTYTPIELLLILFGLLVGRRFKNCRNAG